MPKCLVVYVSPWCYNCSDVREALKSWGVTATFVDIKKDPVAAKRVRFWTGYESVPTLLLAEEGSVEPSTEPEVLGLGVSPRGVDRGSMLTEPTRGELKAWLIKNGLLQAETR